MKNFTMFESDNSDGAVQMNFQTLLPMEYKIQEHQLRKSEKHQISLW